MSLPSDLSPSKGLLATAVTSHSGVQAASLDPESWGGGVCLCVTGAFPKIEAKQTNEGCTHVTALVLSVHL